MPSEEHQPLFDQIRNVLADTAIDDLPPAHWTEIFELTHQQIHDIRGFGVALREWLTEFTHNNIAISADMIIGLIDIEREEWGPPVMETLLNLAPVQLISCIALVQRNHPEFCDWIMSMMNTEGVTLFEDMSERIWGTIQTCKDCACGWPAAEGGYDAH